MRELERGIGFVKTIYAGQMHLLETLRQIGGWDEIEIKPEDEIELRIYVRDRVLELIIEKKNEIEEELNKI